MSTNCVSCVKNKRTGNDLLCDQCRLEDARQVSEKRKEMLLRIARERNAWQKRAEEAERKLEASADVAEEAIRHYRCHYTVIDGDGDAYPLIDKLSNGGTVADGEQEIDMLVDAVCGAILQSTPDVKSSLITSRLRVVELEEVLQRWLSLHEEPCRLDHHANCQSHFLEPYCIVARTRNALAAKTEPTTADEGDGK